MLAIEGLSLLIKYALQEKKLKLFNACREISHFIFVDDVLLFCKGDRANIVNLENLLCSFGWLSSLKANLQKSNLFIGGNFRRDTYDSASIPEGQLPIKYLGILLHGKKLKACSFSPLVDKLKLG